MQSDRRALLKGLAAAAATAALPAGPAIAREKRTAPSDAVGLLYDATRCIGCRACVVACKEANDLPADTTTYGDGLYDAPAGLNERTKTIIQLYREGHTQSYVKKQCMHCVDPACAAGCMLGALQKRELGIVSWDASRCVGCRYCQTACPFGVPQFEWSKKAPKIVKCELCRHLLAKGQQPACSGVCPRQAVIFGKREDLLADAHRRLADSPNTYVQTVYGEHELGGTQVLYISQVPFDKLGFRFDSQDAVPKVQQLVQHGVYQGFLVPAALYAVLGTVVFRNRGKGSVDASLTDEEK
jgi:Fe-S-cluster-containing dehydrogenase component